MSTRGTRAFARSSTPGKSATEASPPLFVFAPWRWQSFSNLASRPAIPVRFSDLCRSRRASSVAHMCPRPLPVWFASFVSRKDARSQSLREARSMMIASESFPANESSAGISTGSSEDGEQHAHPTSSCLTEGFTIQTKTHVLGCACDVCTKLRQITKSSCALEDQTVSPKKIIFVGYDGGFVVRKLQQKHRSWLSLS